MTNFKFNLICGTVLLGFIWAAILVLGIEIKDLRERLFFTQKQRDADIEWVERELKRVKEKPAVGHTQSYGFYWKSPLNPSYQIYYNPSKEVHAFYLNPDGTLSAAKPKEKKWRRQ